MLIDDGSGVGAPLARGEPRVSRSRMSLRTIEPHASPFHPFLHAAGPRLEANLNQTGRDLREAAVAASKEQLQEENDAIAALQRDLEAARYTAQRAQRQYDAADPENRLVTGELERRWNQALQRVNEIEGRIQSYSADKQYAAATPEEFADVAAQLDMVWHDSRSDASLKKRIVRTLIEEVVADADVLGAFVGDATITLTRRVVRHEPLAEAHRTHAYQRAVQSGWSHARVSAAVMILNVTFAALVWGTLAHPAWAPTAYGLAIGLAVAAYLAVGVRAARVGRAHSSR